MWWCSVVVAKEEQVTEGLADGEGGMNSCSVGACIDTVEATVDGAAVRVLGAAQTRKKAGGGS